MESLFVHPNGASSAITWSTVVKLLPVLGGGQMPIIPKNAEVSNVLISWNNFLLESMKVRNPRFLLTPQNDILNIYTAGGGINQSAK